MGARWKAGQSLLAGAALTALFVPFASAQDWVGATGDFNTFTNWNPTTIPGSADTAFFGTAGVNALTLSQTTTVGGWTFNAGAQAYTFTTNTAAGNNYQIYFMGTGITVNGGSALINNTLGGTINFNNSSSVGGASIVNDSTSVVNFFATSNAGSGSITNNGELVFYGTSKAGTANITNNFSISFFESSSADSATITNNNYLIFYAKSNAGNANIINNLSGTVEFSNSTGTANDHKISAGSIAGAGNYFLGINELTVGSSGLSTEVSGVIEDGGFTPGTGASLVKTGAGALTLSGINTYTGPTTVNGGALIVNGSIASSSLTTVNAVGTLAGTGTVGKTAINGGTFAPGSGTPGSFMTVNGDLTFTGGTYQVSVNPATSSFAKVTGTADLGGAGVNAVFAPGSYVAKQYTILTADGGLGGTTFASVSTSGSANVTSSLSYDVNNAYLDVALNFATPNGLNRNQQAVANTLTNFFNTTGGIPMAFGALSPQGLSQVSGELATGTQQATLQAQNMFMSVMTDPFITGRGDQSTGSAGGVSSYADDGSAALNYAANGRQRTANERDAYAMVYSKAPIRTFEPRLSVWGAGYGGSQTTDGNAATGSSKATSSVYGGVAGVDYLMSPNAMVGFALAGGGTNFNVSGAGTGRSDLFQAGLYARYTSGAAYLTAAFAYGWQDITTDRTVTASGIDRLHASFNANAYSGRVESGYRFVSPIFGGIGLTPYAAGQVTLFDLPSYAEQALSGSSQFALSYASKDVTATRSELGLRGDKSYALTDGVLTLRGRAAWAHNFDPDRAIGATFQTLPGASFVVNGAAQANDAALLTASAERKWLNGWSVAGTFEGEFSSVTNSYAGRGVVRYAW